MLGVWPAYWTKQVSPADPRIAPLDLAYWKRRCVPRYQPACSR
jgi:hypothetical protein